MVELGLVLPLLAVALMFLLVSYEAIEQYTELHIQTYAELRSQCRARDNGIFSQVYVQKNTTIIIPGTLPQIIGKGIIPLNTKMSSYAGAIGGVGMSTYRHSGFRRSMVSR